jgi:hypothetical protein
MKGGGMVKTDLFETFACAFYKALSVVIRRRRRDFVCSWLRCLIRIFSTANAEVMSILFTERARQERLEVERERAGDRLGGVDGRREGEGGERSGWGNVWDNVGPGRKRSGVRFRIWEDEFGVPER